VIRFRTALAVLAVASAAAAFGLRTPAGAAPTPAPKASPTPGGSPAPAPSASQEPLDKQIPRLEGVLKANPNDRDAMINLAADYLAVNRPDLTAQLTQKLFATGAKTAQTYFLDGAANASLGKVKESIASFEQASNLEPTNMQVLQALAQGYLQANRPDDAERVAKRALTFNPKSKDAYLNYGFVLAVEKKYDEARQQFDTAAKLDPSDPHPLVLEARTYAEQNAMALAAQLFDRALAVNPNDLEALVGKAELLSGEHNVKDAIATYTTILGLQQDDTNRAAVVDEMGKLYAIEKMDSDADTTFRRAIDSYPNVPGGHLVYGDYLQTRNDKAGAEREWTAALGPNRDNPEALQRLGALAAQNKDLPKAIGFYKRLTEVSSKDPRSFLFLGEAYMAHRDYSLARDVLKQSYSLGPSPDALVTLAAADQQLKNFSEAIQIYEAIDKSAPDLVKSHPEILYAMGKAYQGSNQQQKARGVYVRFLAVLQPGSSGYKEVQGLITGIDHGSSAAAARPAPTATPHHN
jgi:tetratricopeptide (TPR) repeat protein